MGVVHRAFDLRLRRPVALKILHEGLSAEAMARMVREARLAAALTHPNIVAVFDVGEHFGMPFMAMELVDGRQLRIFVGSPSPVQDKVRWLTDAARGLAAAHGAGLVHRDVKPQNVMVTPTGAKILDFGIARQLDENEKNLTALLPSLRTQPGFSIGTPLYMAPEVLRGEHRSDARTDQFSWGIVAWQLLMGEQPPRAEKLTERWVAPRIEAFGVSEKIAAIVARALDDDRSRRFESMDALVAALEDRSAVPEPPASNTQSMPSVPSVGARSSANIRAAVAMPAAAISAAPASAPPESVPPDRFSPTRLFAVQIPDLPKPEKQPEAPPSPRAASSKTKLPVRDPKREVLQPLTDAALAELSVGVPLGFRKAVLIVTIDTEGPKARYFVQVVALDETAELWAPDASGDLMRAAGNMILADAKDGNGRWQRLVLRLQRGSREAVIADIV